MKFKLAFFKVASYLLVYLLAFVTSVKLPKKVFRRSKGNKDRVKPYVPFMNSIFSETVEGPELLEFKS